MTPVSDRCPTDASALRSAESATRSGRPGRTSAGSGRRRIGGEGPRGRRVGARPGRAALAAGLVWLAATAAAQSYRITVDPAFSDGDFTVTWSGPLLSGATYRLTENGPDGVQFHTSSPVELSGKPPGLYTFTLLACSAGPLPFRPDGGEPPDDDDGSTRSWNCEPALTELAFVNSRPVVAAIADRTMESGATATVTVTVTDAETFQTHTVDANSSDTGVVGVSVSGKTLTLTGVSTGEATITVTATDGSGASNAMSTPVTFRATVAASNSRPAVGAMVDRTVWPRAGTCTPTSATTR